jgi:tripartite-type tricarboxylate transporter receptor subunit TctC
MSFRLHAIILAFCGVIFHVTPSPSAENPFYQGKNVTFLINFAAGGPTDIEGRIVARHLVKHIPGNPRSSCRTCPARGE